MIYQLIVSFFCSQSEMSYGGFEAAFFKHNQDCSTSWMFSDRRDFSQLFCKFATDLKGTEKEPPKLALISKIEGLHRI